MPRRRRGRDISGILLLDKPAGISSNQALQRARRLFDARKAGHTGSLDPLATGMLPLCFGEATKVSGFLLGARKRYVTTAMLGASTDTGDLEGTVVERAPVPQCPAEQVAAILARFEGEIDQVPPMYSALKHEGERLYRLARAGQVVERAARRVTIHAIRRVGAPREVGPEARELTLEVSCSKGTYIRTLVEDVARALGTVGHVTSLHRLSVSPFEDRPMVTLEALEPLDDAARDAMLLPADAALAELPAVTLDAAGARGLSHGQSVSVGARGGGPNGDGPTLCRAYGPDGRFLGLVDAMPDGTILARRLFVAG